MVDIEEEVDFEDVYAWFNGTIYADRDCGRTVCGNYTCCYPVFDHGEPLYIIYLPGELEFLRQKLDKKVPSREIGRSARFHCRGNEQCVYAYRPIDCRSYPLWPVVEHGELVGFYDERGSTCRVEEIPEAFIEQMRENWLQLMKNPAVRHWLEFEVPKSFGRVIRLKK